MNKVKLSDFGKLLVILAILASATALAALGKVSADAATALYLVVLGYITGNGVLALRRKPPSPMIAHPTTADGLDDLRTRSPFHNAAGELLTSDAATDSGEGPTS